MHSLSRPRRQLVRLMQHLQFGWIGGLLVVKGEPQLQPKLRIVRTIALGLDAAAPMTPRTRDFALKHTVKALFDLFDRKQSLSIERLDVQHGLPSRIQFDDQSAWQMLETIE